MRTDHSKETLIGGRGAFLMDVVVVLAFVLIGRESHDEGNAFVDVMRTAAPFLGGLVAGWLLAAASRTPLSVRTGLVVAAVTVLVGLPVRRVVFGGGIALPFVIVTTLVLVAGLVGWRTLVAAVRGRPSSA